MHDIVKIANELKNTNDIIVTAGFLSRLKNKILGLFDKSKRENVEEMVEETNDLKPQLIDAYDSIRNVERAIEDLDVNRYEEEIKNLQPKIDALSETVKRVRALTNEPRYRVAPEHYIEKYKHDGVLYKNLNEFGKQFGVDLQYGTNIIGNRNGVKSIFTSWAAAIFTGKLKDSSTGEFSAGEFSKEHEDPMAFSELQDRITDDSMIDRFYKDIPYYEIQSVKPRETRVIDNKDTKLKKSGSVEVFLISPWITVPKPADNWKLRVSFVIVDNGNPTQNKNFIIYRQWVVGIKKVFDEPTS
jgi:hypothetical protein